MATLISVVVAIFTFGLNRGRTMDQVMDTINDSIKIIAMMLMVIGGGGAFKQILVDGGVAKYIETLMAGSTLSPLLTITGVSLELMVLAVGSGSVIFSHVNDPGFWLFKEYFNLTIGETMKSWSALETIIAVCGLIGCLLLSMVI